MNLEPFPFHPMKALLRSGFLLAVFLFVVPRAGAQYLFSVTFRGTNYQADATGKVLPQPMTEESILQALAAPIGADPKAWALVYHVAANGFGDTLEIVDAKTGAPLDTYLGFYFGEDVSLNRMAITNAAGTQTRRIDYLYTSQNTHSMGAAFVTKRYLRDGAGNTRTTIEGQLHWVVAPTASSGTRICIGSFTTTRPFVRR
jgi:hypothetical protein